MNTIKTPVISYSLVGIESDGITTRHCIIYGEGITSRAAARDAWLAGERGSNTLLDDRDEPFFDVNPVEYILSIDLLMDGKPAVYATWEEAEADTWD